MIKSQQIANLLQSTLTGKDPGLHIETCQKAIDELRRLDAENAALRAEMKQLDEAHDWQYRMAGDRLRRIEKDENLLRQCLLALEAMKFYTTSVHTGLRIADDVIIFIRERLGITVTTEN